MKQIKNGFADYYYLSEEGLIYNAKSEKYIKPDSRHRFKLKDNNNRYKTISLKTLYKMIYNKIFCEDNIENLPFEEWKVIENTNDLYYISSAGRVKSYQGYKAIILKPFANQRGYQRIEIVENGYTQSKLLHRLVAFSFLPKPQNIDFQLHHIDGNKQFNSKDNLIWLSPADHRKAHKELKEQRRNILNVSSEPIENIHRENN